MVVVAISGDVNDKESGQDSITETGPALNPNLRGRSIREAFNTDEYQVLLVANRFQTGFGQPLLSGMYVDRRWACIQAVQTLSRLDRAQHQGTIREFARSQERAAECDHRRARRPYRDE